MDKQINLSVVGSQLDRVLSFFPRVEAKISTLFAVNAAMLGVLALNTRVGDQHIWYLVLLYLAASGFIAWSVWSLYKASYPQLEGGAQSLVYFKTISERRETSYIEEMDEVELSAYTKDLLGQVWRNSEILTEKYKHVKTAFICTAIALVPWVAAVAVATSEHAQLVVR